jgi:hypothetical protein
MIPTERALPAKRTIKPFMEKKAAQPAIKRAEIAVININIYTIILKQLRTFNSHTV